MSAFEKLNGVRQIDPQSLIELSLSFAKEENMTNRAAAAYICCELRAFMKEMNAIITLKDLDIDQSNHISFELNLKGDSKEIKPYIRPLINNLIEMGCPPELASESVNRVFDNFTVVDGFGCKRYGFIKNPNSYQELKEKNNERQSGDN